ncbi:hypothetical protein L0F63_007310 [Massospora cicadina]|nr:hypothetical protein L0F63_007310 [Massospora cicadina]
MISRKIKAKRLTKKKASEPEIEIEMPDAPVSEVPFDAKEEALPVPSMVENTGSSHTTKADAEKQANEQLTLPSPPPGSPPDFALSSIPDPLFLLFQTLVPFDLYQDFLLKCQIFRRTFLHICSPSLFQTKTTLVFFRLCLLLSLLKIFMLGRISQFHHHLQLVVPQCDL